MAVRVTRTGLLSWRFDFTGWHALAALLAYGLIWGAIIYFALVA